MKKLKNFKVLSFLILCGAVLCIGASLMGNFGGTSLTLAISKNFLLAGSAGEFFANAWAYIVANWIYFAAGGAVLILLIILIIVVCVTNHKKKVKRAKEEELARTMELKEASEAIKGNDEEEAEVEVQEEPAEPENVQPAEQQEMPNDYPASMFEGHKPYPEIMDYIKMRMKIDAQRNNQQNFAPVQTIDVPQENVVDERVRQIQKEYQEELRRIDEILHEQEKEKLREEMQKEQDMIDKLEEEYEIADKLLDELNDKAQPVQ